MVKMETKKTSAFFSTFSFQIDTLCYEDGVDCAPVELINEGQGRHAAMRGMDPRVKHNRNVAVL